MAITVKMPQLGESVTEGTIGSWLVEPGQQVNKFDSLVEVITDKVTAEVPSPAAGTVGEILATEGQRLSVGEPICTLNGAEEEPEQTSEAAPEDSEAPAPASAAVEPAEVAPAQLPRPMAAPAPPPGTAEPAGFLSPAVRTLAEERQVDLSKVTGTGFQGRITKRDVLIFAEAGAAPAGPPQLPAAAKSVSAAPPPGPGERVVLSPMRRAIAEHMVRSRQTSPHAWTMVEVDMSGVAAARAAHHDRFRKATGVDLTFLPFAMQATCVALRAVPTMNAVFDGDAVVLKREINLGLAVSIPDGLIVPVVRGADRYSLAGLAQAAAELIGRARAGKARMEDVEGGTFTLNNAGSLGTVMSQAIINQPQAGILVTDAVIRRPVVIGDAIAIRPMMNLCLSFDHRVNDGASAARLLGAAKSWLESITEQTPVS
jgi:2-oxoisovalerate dehydrogenase E2 component (dihydrolipoyl transacylase)